MRLLFLEKMIIKPLKDKINARLVKKENNGVIPVLRHWNPVKLVSIKVMLKYNISDNDGKMDFSVCYLDDRGKKSKILPFIANPLYLFNKV